MFFQIVSKAFFDSLGLIGQSIPILLFWCLTVVLLGWRIWSKGGSGIAGHVKKTLESVGICVLAWLPFFFWSLGYEAKGIEIPSVISFSTPLAPKGFNTSPPPTEPKNSLRRRTLRLADELEAFWKERNEKRMSVNITRDANGRIPTLTDFDTETNSLYVSRGIKEKSVEILTELRGKGLNVAPYYDAAGVAQTRPLGGEELVRLRDLAYHLDSQGNVIRIDY